MVEGPGADSEEKHEPVSDIDTAAADSLKVLDLKRPIREADIGLSRLTSAIAADQFSKGVVAGTSPRTNCRHISFCNQADWAIKKNLRYGDMEIRALDQQT